MSRTPIGRALQPEKASTSKVHSDSSPPRSFSFSWFVTYKFLNSLFMGLSIGSVFTLYAPLSPATFSAGGIGLALATLIIATQYHRLFNRDWFFRLSFPRRVRHSLGRDCRFITTDRPAAGHVRIFGLPAFLRLRRLSGAV